MPLFAKIQISDSTPLAYGKGGLLKERVVFSPSDLKAEELYRDKHYAFALFNTKTDGFFKAFLKRFLAPWKAISLEVQDVSGKSQKIFVSILSVATRLGLTKEEVQKAHKEGTLLRVIEKQFEEIPLPRLTPESEKLLEKVRPFLNEHQKQYQENAKASGMTVRIKQGKNGSPPATMAFTPSGRIFIHVPHPRHRSPIPGGISKEKKMAILIEPDGRMTEVARVGGISEMNQSNFATERSILERLQRDKDQIRFFGASQGQKKKGNVKKETFYLENFPEGSLNDYLKCQEGRELSLAQKYQIGEGLIRSLYGLHQRGIAHCDLKPENVFYNSSTQKAVVADFDVSKIASDNTEGVNGTFLYSAPEKRKAYRTYDWDSSKELKADIWSLGLVLYRLFSGKDILKGDFLDKIACDETGTLILDLPQGPIRSILETMLQNAPEKRADIETILEKWKETNFTKIG